MESVKCEEIVFRLALNAKCVKPNSTEAFLLRPNDKGRLSVFRLTHGSIEKCAEGFNRPKGAFTLHVGTVRTIKSLQAMLDVVEDESEADKCPGHASILNLPDPNLEQEAESAERLATLLRKQSREVPVINAKR